jgi:hypothetical protein
MVKEHKRLVRVLESPGHEDDKIEAQKQAAELMGYEGKPVKKPKTLAIGSKVKIIRANLAPSLVKEMPSSIFWNDATVKAKKGDRIQVEVLGEKYWFDSEALEPAANSEEPVTVRPASESKGFKIPDRPSKSSRTEKREVMWDGKYYKVKSSKVEIPDLSAMGRIEALIWINKNTYARGRQKPDDPLTGMGDAVSVSLAKSRPVLFI